MTQPIRLSTGTHENFRTLTVVEALRALVPEGVVLAPVPRHAKAALPEGVSPVLAAVAAGSSQVAWDRSVLDPDEMLDVLPLLHGTAADPDAERARLDALADHFLAEGLPHVLRVARGLGARVAALEALLPLDRERLTGSAYDRPLLDAKHELARIYRDASRSKGGMEPNPEWRCLDALAALEDGVRHLRDIDGPAGRGEPRPGEDPDDPWVSIRMRRYAEQGDRARMRDLEMAAEAFARAATLATLARRLVGEDSGFQAPALLERLAAEAPAPSPGPR